MKKIYIFLKKNSKIYRNIQTNYFIEDKHPSKKLKMQKKCVKIKDNLNKIYIIYFYLFLLSEILFLQFIKCYNIKFQLAFTYVGFKINGTGNIKIYSNIYKGPLPNFININNKINYTNSEINNSYCFNNSENDINNITLAFNNPINPTEYLCND